MTAPRRPPSSRPFLAAPRTDFYHPARGIEAALHGIERAIRRSEGIGLVVGAPGTGKTLLLAKVAEHVRDDFDVALLSGARICTRRALWQSILAEIGEPYRGIDEGELRIGVVERVRGLAATGSGLVILVDEAHTLPTRLLEELRLLTNTPAPLPSVHVVLAGTTEMEERLGGSRMESLAQRIGARHYLDSLDHAETLAYLRTQMRVAGQRWEQVFDEGADEAVYAATDGVPRLVNQVCDVALVTAADRGRSRVSAADVAAAWREIQRLPEPGRQGAADDCVSGFPGHDALAAGGSVVEFGTPDGGFDDPADADLWQGRQTAVDFGAESCPDVMTWDGVEDSGMPAERHEHPCTPAGEIPAPRAGQGPFDPWEGPDIEIVLDGHDDPFAGFFTAADGSAAPPAVERYHVRGPDDFSGRRQVSSREGTDLARRLPERATPAERGPAPDSRADAATPVSVAADDSDMVVIEEDEWTPPADPRAWRVQTVRPGDYSRLFARLRRGGSEG